MSIVIIILNNVQNVLSLLSDSLFKLALESFQHDFYSLVPCFPICKDVSFPSPDLQLAISSFYGKWYFRTTIRVLGESITTELIIVSWLFECTEQ